MITFVFRKIFIVFIFLFVAFESDNSLDLDLDLAYVCNEKLLDVKIWGTWINGTAWMA